MNYVFLWRYASKQGIVTPYSQDDSEYEGLFVMTAELKSVLRGETSRVVNLWVCNARFMFYFSLF